MPKPNTDGRAGDLGVTIRAETNAVLNKIKKKTGLSKSMLANIGLAFLSNEILDGRLVVVNNEIQPTRHEKQAA